MLETQRSYGKPKDHRHRSENWASKPYKKNVRDVQCCNCNEKGHYSTNCPKSERTMMKTVHQVLKRNAHTSEKVLFELCYAFDGAQSSSSTSSSSSESENEENVVTKLKISMIENQIQIQNIFKWA